MVDEGVCIWERRESVDPEDSRLNHELVTDRAMFKLHKLRPITMTSVSNMADSIFDPDVKWKPTFISITLIYAQHALPARTEVI